MNKKKKKQYVIVANWKTHLSFYESISLCSVNQEKIKILSKKQQLVFLPSFIALNAVAQLLKETNILYGAQNCSEYEHGAYTGEISVSMLKELACSFCLVGHSERRIYFNETDEIIAKKYRLLKQKEVQPILCVGELEKQKTIKATKTIVKNQLSFLSKETSSKQTTQKKIYIAYEPAWAITKRGKSNAAEPGFVAEMIEHIAILAGKFCDEHRTNKNLVLLYGASVDEKNVINYAAIQSIDGFLLGSSGTKFKALASIISVLSQ